MSLEAGDRLREIIVQPVYAVALGILCLGCQHGTAVHQFPQALADSGVVGKILRNDVGGTGQGILHCLHALIRVYIISCQFLGVPAVLSKDRLSQGFQPFLSGNRTAGTALLFIRAVQILHLSKGGRLVNG